MDKEREKYLAEEQNMTRLFKARTQTSPKSVQYADQ